MQVGVSRDNTRLLHQLVRRMQRLVPSTRLGVLVGTATPSTPWHSSRCTASLSMAATSTYITSISIRRCTVRIFSNRSTCNRLSLPEATTHQISTTLLPPLPQDLGAATVVLNHCKCWVAIGTNRSRGYPSVIDLD